MAPQEERRQPGSDEIVTVWNGTTFPSYRRHPPWSPTIGIIENLLFPRGNNPDNNPDNARANTNDERDQSYKLDDKDAESTREDEHLTCRAPSNHKVSGEDATKSEGIVVCSALHCSIWLLFTLIFWALLYTFATAYDIVETETVLSLTSGETWQVLLPELWFKEKFEIKSTREEPGLNVYLFPPMLSNRPGECPSLTGPPVTFDERESVVLSGDRSFEYNYFNLNAGSRIHLVTRQWNGTSNIFLLQGVHILKAIQEGEPIDYHGDSIMKRYSGIDGTTALHYHVEASDLYILIFENSNQHQSLSRLGVHFRVTQATHSLQQHTPICGAADTFKGCVWNLENDSDRRELAASCVILQAVSGHAKSADNKRNTTNPRMAAAPVKDLEGRQVVQAQLGYTVTCPRKLWWIAFVPVVAAWWIHNLGAKKIDLTSRSWTRRGLNSEKRPLMSSCRVADRYDKCTLPVDSLSVKVAGKSSGCS